MSTKIVRRKPKPKPVRMTLGFSRKTYEGLVRIVEGRGRGSINELVNDILEEKLPELGREQSAPLGR